jgi:UDP-glucose 4-epimerase
MKFEFYSEGKMNIDGLHCLVTGGAGFIGSHLVDELMGKGCSVRVLDNLTNGKLENISGHLKSGKCEFRQGSVTDPFDVGHAVEGIDIVFHLACLGVRNSISHPFENHRVNAEGALLLLNAASMTKVKRFIYCSSSEVYGTAQYIPMNESHPTNPCTVYGAGKLAGEAYARAFHKTYNLKVVIIRPFNVYGPRSHYKGDAGEMIPKSIVRALNGKPIIIFGDGLQTRDFTYVGDTVRALTLAAENDIIVGETFNVGSGFEITMNDLALKIIGLVKNEKARIDLSSGRPGDVLRLYADSTKFTDLCGWRPQVDFDNGLIRTVDYFLNHPSGINALIEAETGRNWEERGT